MTPLTEAIRFQRDLYLFWREAHVASGLPVTTRGYLTQPALRRVARKLASIDGRQFEPLERTEVGEVRLFYLRRLLQRLSLLRAAPEDARLVAAPPGEINRYLAYTLAERLRICVRVWIAGGWWPDHPDPRAPLSRLMAPAPPRLALTRRRILDRLTHHADETSFTASTRPVRIASARSKAAMPESEEEIWNAALSGPLSWMGLVADEGHTDDENLIQVPDTGPGTSKTFRKYRATPAALALRSEAESSSIHKRHQGRQDDEEQLAEVHGRLLVQPNFEVIAYPPLTGPILWLLDTCAEEVALERTARYQLTRPAFVAAHQQNWTAALLIGRLEALTTMSLPENVRITLCDWERQAERLQMVQNIRLLEVGEASILDALLADRALAPAILRRLTDTAAILAPEAIAQVRAWLLQQGELPAIKQIGAKLPPSYPGSD